VQQGREYKGRATQSSERSETQGEKATGFIFCKRCSYMVFILGGVLRSRNKGASGN
jgi:hypothetical protein